MPEAAKVKIDLSTMEVRDARLDELLRLFPEAVTEGKIDFARLRQTLGDAVDPRKEKYGLSWAGKSEAIQVLQTSAMGTLVPMPEESVNFESSENLIIEGDNLEVLKLLQKSYYGKVKMIYIDPPYNTGNEFIYPDNFKEGLDDYLKYSGQTTEDGLKLSTNTEGNGRYHSKWLNMMYPRLFLAKNLLRQDGVIFVSIDDREVHNLRSLMNEIFGEENFIAQITREAIKGGSQSKYIRTCHDYVLVYAKNTNELEFSGYDQEGITLDLKDEKGAYAKGRELNKWGAGSRREDAQGMWYPILGPNGEDVYPIRNDGSEGRWRLGKKKLFQLVKDKDVIYEKRSNGTYIVYQKIRDNAPRIKQFTTIFKDNYINAKGTERIKELYKKERSYFDYAKPVELIYDLMVMAAIDSDDIVLDFFAGSATTADAVLKYNVENDVSATFVVVQLPEKLEPDSEAYKAGFKTISELSQERVRHSIAAFNTQLSSHQRNLGFKAFKLSSSNFKEWRQEDNNTGDEAFAQQLRLHIENVKEQRGALDIVYEIALKLGYELSVAIEQITLAKQPVYSIAGGEFLLCVEKKITTETLRKMMKHKPKRIMCLDVAFEGNDTLKTNIVLEMQSHSIEFHTV